MVSLISKKWTPTFPHVFILNEEIWVGFGRLLYVKTKDLISFHFNSYSHTFNPL